VKREREKREERKNTQLSLHAKIQNPRSILSLRRVIRRRERSEERKRKTTMNLVATTFEEKT
jgi:hypothetical protein